MSISAVKSPRVQQPQPRTSPQVAPRRSTPTSPAAHFRRQYQADSFQRKPGVAAARPRITEGSMSRDFAALEKRMTSLAKAKGLYDTAKGAPYGRAANLIKMDFETARSAKDWNGMLDALQRMRRVTNELAAAR